MFWKDIHINNAISIQAKLVYLTVRTKINKKLMTPTKRLFFSYTGSFIKNYVVYCYILFLNRIILGTSEVKDGKAAVSLRNTISIATNRLFIGGIPKKYNISFTLGVRSSLNGCVREVFEKK